MPLLLTLPCVTLPCHPRIRTVLPLPLFVLLALSLPSVAAAEEQVAAAEKQQRLR